MKPDVDKSDVAELKIFPEDFTNVESRVSKRDVDKLKTVLVNLTKLSDVAVQDDIEKTLFDKLSSRVAGLGNKAPRTSTLIHKIHYETPWCSGYHYCTASFN